MESDTLCLNRLVLVDVDYDKYHNPNYIAIYDRDKYFIVPNVLLLFDVVDQAFYLPFQINNKRVYMSFDDD